MCAKTPTKRSPQRTAKPAECRVCGCDQGRACLVAGVPCCWVEPDLCSACATIGQILACLPARAWLINVADGVDELLLLDLAGNLIEHAAAGTAEGGKSKSQPTNPKS